MNLSIPDFCLVLLFGAQGTNHPDFLSRHFAAEEIVPPGAGDMFAAADGRLALRELTVVEATNLTKEDRGRLLAIAKLRYTEAVAIVVDPRPVDRFDHLHREGVRTVHELRSPEAIASTRVLRSPLACDLRGEAGHFDIVGDVHGCADELEALLAELGYSVEWTVTDRERACSVKSPGNRRIVFVGDVVDRGPRTPGVLRIVMASVGAGTGLAVLGNHDVKFARWLDGRDVTFTRGLRISAEQMDSESAAFRQAVGAFMATLPVHLWLAGGALAVAHAGIRQAMIGRVAGGVREFCLYGDATGETDEYGNPIRLDWAADYHGTTTVIYGHTVVRDALWFNNTICVDTGCCFGGRLTALRWPERELVAVPAARAYAPANRPPDAMPSRSTTK